MDDRLDAKARHGVDEPGQISDVLVDELVATRAEVHVQELGSRDRVQEDHRLAPPGRFTRDCGSWRKP